MRWTWVWLALFLWTGTSVAQNEEMPPVRSSDLFRKVSIYSRDLTVPVSYDELCVYDSFCRILKPNGSDITYPNPTALNVFKRFRSTVFEIASIYKIDPALLISVIVTEHSLNVGIDDIFQNQLVASGLAPDGNLLGVKKFTYGFGQIYSDAVKRAEVIVAEFEKREVKPNGELYERLMTIEGALTYAAGILVDAQREYAKSGLDISQDPGALASVYNLGGPDQRAAATKASGLAPRVNYFGWFVLQHWSKFYDALAEDSPASFLMTVEELEASKIQDLGYDLYPVYELRKSVPFFLRPQRCLNSNRTFNNMVSNESISRDQSGTGPFEIISQSLDCIGKEWSLIRMLDGRSGWVSHAEIERHVGQTYKMRWCHQDESVNRCSARIAQLDAKLKILLTDKTENFIDVQLATFRPDKKIDTRSVRPECLQESTRAKYIAEVEAQDANWEKSFASSELGPVAQDRVWFEKLKRDRPVRAALFEKLVQQYGNHRLVDLSREDAARIDAALLAKRQEAMDLLGIQKFEDLRWVYGTAWDRLILWEGVELRGEELQWNGRTPQLLTEACRVQSQSGDFVDICRTAPAEEILAAIEKINVREMYGDPATVFLDSRKSRMSFFFETGTRSYDFEAREKYLQQSEAWDRWTLDDEILQVEERCSYVASQFAVVREAIGELKGLSLEAKKLPPSPFLKIGAYKLQQVFATCSAYRQYMESPLRGTGAAIPISIDFLTRNVLMLDRSKADDRLIWVAHPKMTNKRSGLPSVNPISSQRFGLLILTDAQIKTSLLSMFKDEVAAALSYSMDRVRERLTGKKTFDRYVACAYDPITSADWVNKISELECVERIEVPDEVNMLQRLALTNKKVVGLPAADFNDRFRVRLAPKCQYVN